MRVLINICRILVGLLFIYSGFVKGIDPLGSNYKFTDYFNAFHMDWMAFSALFFSFILSLAEFLIGACLLLNIKIKTASWGALLFMGFFTPLTLVLAIKNPVTDCGCFGDALVLTNWETFWKNVILLAMTLAIFFNRNKFRSMFNFLEQTVLLFCVTIAMLSVEIYSYRHLPIIDFRPYAIGKNIAEGMRLPEGAPHDEYKTILEYKNKNTGEVKEFDETNYPWQDTLNWEYSNTISKLVKEGYKAPIHGFSIQHPEIGDITEEVLQDNGYTFLLIAYRLDKASTTDQESINKLATYALGQGHKFYGLTATNPDEVKKFTEANNVPFEFCSTDEIQLKTIIRSNPGLIVLRNGTILGKWSHRDLPGVEELQDKDVAAFCLQQQQSRLDNHMVYTLILLAACFLFLFTSRKYKRQAK